MVKLCLSLCLFFSLSLSAQDTVKISSKMSNATVYFGYGAELTHHARARVTSATRTIVISNLSTTVDINSLQISCPEDVALLSHKFSVYYPPAAEGVGSTAADALRDSMAILNREYARLENQIGIEQEKLTKTGNLIETTISTSGNKTITSAEVLRLVEHYNQRIQESKTNIFNHKQALAKLTHTINSLQERIIKLNPPRPVAPKPYGQLVLQVICRNAGEIPLALSYYTSNAGWTPVYDIRVNSKTNIVKLVYKASLTQTTGIDWQQAKLTLSTGTPNFGVSAPVLTPWSLQLYVPGIYTDMQRRAEIGNRSRNAIQSMNDDKALSEVVVTGYTNGLEVKRVQNEIDPSTLQQFTTLTEGQLNTNFEIDLPYDIESDGQLHSVTIRNEEIKCFLKNYAVPRIDRDAYLLAEVGDWQNLDLLPGDANIIMDDTYIGKSVIDPNTTADTLNLSLGRDKRVAVKRSLVKEATSLKTSGSTSRNVFTYEIIVKNNKLTDVSLLLKDQFPLSTIKEVEVKLEEDGGASVNVETGVLTWKVDLKPGESKKYRFSYSVKYPKDKKIINLK